MQRNLKLNMLVIKLLSTIYMQTESTITYLSYYPGVATVKATYGSLPAVKTLLADDDEDLVSCYRWCKIFLGQPIHHTSTWPLA